jgi:hypothetical protein
MLRTPGEFLSAHPFGRRDVQNRILSCIIVYAVLNVLSLMLDGEGIK